MIYTVKLQATRTVYIEVDGPNAAIAGEKAVEAYREDWLLYSSIPDEIVDVLSVSEEGL